MRQELERAKKELGLTDAEFSAARLTHYAALLQQILERHTIYAVQGKQKLWLWEGLRPPVSSYICRNLDEGLSALALLLPLDERLYLLAEDWDDKRDGNYWVYEGSAAAILKVLTESHAFEFYIVGRKLDWLLCQNHHDILLATGEPMVTRLDALKVKK